MPKITFTKVNGMLYIGYILTFFRKSSSLQKNTFQYLEGVKGYQNKQKMQKNKKNW